jgi:hypothetical protein
MLCSNTKDTTIYLYHVFKGKFNLKKEYCLLFCLYTGISYYTPRKQSLGGYIGIALSVRPCTLQVQLLLTGLLDFYETLHICSTLPADVHEGIWLLSKI